MEDPARVDPGIEAIRSRVDAFRQLVNVSYQGDKAVLELADPTAVANLLAEIQREIDGVDEIYEEHYLARCVEAQIEPATLLAVPADTDAQKKQRDRNQLGDVGELFACLAIAALDGYEPSHIHPKNLFKLTPNYSERGLDVLALKLEDATTTDALAAGDRLMVLEAKASHTSGTQALHTDAVESDNLVKPPKLRRELRGLKSNARMRTGLHPKHDRIKYFLFSWKAKDDHVVRKAMLVTGGPDTLSETIVANGPFKGAFTLMVDLTKLCAEVYRHRA